MNFLDMFKGDELERMKKAHEKKLKKIQLESELRMKENMLNNELNIQKSSLDNNLKLQKLEARKTELPIKTKIFHLNLEVKSESKLIQYGRILILLGFITTLISTLITISGGIERYNKNLITLLAFIFGISVLQLAIFIIACISSKIKDKFRYHHIFANTLKWLLLIVSIHYNYKFFKSENFFENIFVMIFCICLDLFSIFVVGLGFDMKTLHYSYKTKDSVILNKVKEMINVKYENYIRNQKQKYLDNETKKFLEYAKNTKEQDNKIKSIVDISKDTSIPERKVRKIHNKLVQNGLIKIKDKKSYII